MTVVIATYHAIDAIRAPICASRERLAADLGALRQAGFEIVSLDDCAGWLAGDRSLPDRSAILTFDDGDASVASDALPVLAAAGAAAAVFVVVGRVGSDNQWPGQWRTVPPRRLLDRAALVDLAAAGWTIGAHSWSHSRLTDLDEEAAHREIVGAADALEQIVGQRVRHFAYPYGLFTERERRLAAARFRLALTARPGLVTRSTSPTAVPRLDASDLGWALRLRILASPMLQPYLSARRTARRLRRRIWLER